MTAVFRIAADGTGDMTSLEQAYAQAPPDSVIEIYPGTYEVTFELTKPMIFIGKGGRENVILESHKGSCFALKQPLIVQVKDLSIRGYSQIHPAVLCHQGRLILDHCDIQQRAWSKPTIPSLSLIAAVEIQGDEATPLLRHCRIHNSIGFGVNIENGASPSFQECDIYANQDEGIWIHCSSALFSHCRIYENLGHGIHLDGAGQSRFVECDIFGNGQGNEASILAGISLSHDAECAFLRCQIRHHIGFGIFSALSGRVTFEECKIYENQGMGLAILQGSDLVFRKCHIHGNGDVGAFWGMGGLGILEECHIFSNGKAGLMLDQHANLLLVSTEIYTNTWQGVVAAQWSHVTLHACYIYGNKHEGIHIEEGCEVLFRDTFLESFSGLGVAISKNILSSEEPITQRKWFWPEGCHCLKASIDEETN